MIENVIKSISFDQHEIIRNILALHCGDGNIDLDMTFSKGGFYKNGVAHPKLAVELNEELAKKHGVICADCTALPMLFLCVSQRFLKIYLQKRNFPLILTRGCCPFVMSAVRSLSGRRILTFET